ncbi:N-acetylmuramoyl-L-alanine amidase [Flavobacterium sp.]|jgi:N-acetylmuramoyl-L-alanine amidase|uniref:N-acetylmuramoyl-L-alanine amidase family protein n=1 Tax=Flavobacterium sp. TaxID=239 RepID=UPI003340FE73
MKKSIVLLFLCLFSVSFYAQTKKFKVVLDAGHGGKDYGATYHGNIEKKISLNTVLKVGEILAKESNIEVVYTRKTDVFIELNERANIANRSKGHLFVSMHCNANDNQEASGNETYVMGVTRNAANLEVAKKENAVVTLESDYKIKYDGFDPKSPESVMGISIMQEENIQQSIDIAGKVQQAFTKFTTSKNRGVKQAGFLVLRKIIMPRVLIEMGFVSNKPEGAFLNSEDGQNKLAEAISKAILGYRDDFFKTETATTVKKEESKKATVKKEDPKKVDPKKVDPKQSSENKTAVEGVTFKIQISASAKNLETLPKNFKGLNNISVEKGTTIYKYFYGSTSSYTKAKQLLEEAKAKGYTSSFIVPIKNGKKIKLSEAIK